MSFSFALMAKEMGANEAVMAQRNRRSNCDSDGKNYSECMFITQRKLHHGLLLIDKFKGKARRTRQKGKTRGRLTRGMDKEITERHRKSKEKKLKKLKKI